MAVIMQEWGSASTGDTGHTGEYLADFDFEAHGGIGAITMTPDPDKAKRFADIAEAIAFRNRSPVCRPVRPDGKPNRPLTAANWSFETIQ